MVEEPSRRDRDIRGSGVSMKTSVDVTVIICAYSEDRRDQLFAAVDSVRRQTSVPREIVVVIDHNPGLRERVRAELKDVTVVANEGVRGLSGARNAGVAVATTEIVAFVDDDAIAAPDWMESLICVYEQPNVLGAGGFVEPLWLEMRPRWFPDEFHWVVGCSFRGQPTIAAPIAHLIGANMSFRRAVIERIGGFNVQLGRLGLTPTGCEDTDLCIRARQAFPEGKIIYEPRARVYHRVPASRASWRYFCAYCRGEGATKALLVRFIGSRDGLAVERLYTLRTLPTGVAAGIFDALFRRDPGGLGRAGAIVAGFLMTTAGYFTAMYPPNRLTDGRRLSAQSSSAVPIRLPVRSRLRYRAVSFHQTIKTTLFTHAPALLDRRHRNREKSA